MPEFVRVATEVAALVSTPITDDEAAAMFRACVNLFAQWNLSDAEAAVLLDTEARSFGRWKSGGLGRLGRDQKARLSNLMAVHKALRIIFKDPGRAYEWVRQPNRAFGMRTALDVMMGGDLTDITRVRLYLDAECGG